MARRRKSNGPWFWRGMIMLMVSSVFGLFAVAAFYEPPALDATSGCRLDRKDPAHTVLLIDQSDPFGPNDIAWVEALVDEEARTLRRYGRLTVMVPNAAQPYAPTLVFSKCSPGSPDDANPLVSNPRMVEDTWRELFHAPLVAAVGPVLTDTRQPASPIMEALFTISDRPDFQAGQPSLRLVLVSDLFQHSEDFSFYRSGLDQAAFEASRLADRQPDLAGIDVVARIVPREEYDLPLGEVKAFWRDYFDAVGARYGSVN